MRRATAVHDPGCANRRQGERPAGSHDDARESQPGLYQFLSIARARSRWLGLALSVPLFDSALLGDEQMLGNGEAGQVIAKFANTSVGSGGFAVASLADLRQQNALQAAIVNTSRLHIPVDFTAETLHSGGHPGCTVFPMPAGQGASWNVSLVEAIAAANARQARASGTNHGLSPVINVATDPRFGRFQEAVRHNRHSAAFPQLVHTRQLPLLLVHV